MDSFIYCDACAGDVISLETPHSCENLCQILNTQHRSLLVQYLTDITRRTSLLSHLRLITRLRNIQILELYLKTFRPRSLVRKKFELFGGSIIQICVYNYADDSYILDVLKFFIDKKGIHLDYLLAICLQQSQFQCIKLILERGCDPCTFMSGNSFIASALNYDKDDEIVFLMLSFCKNGKLSGNIWLSNMGRHHWKRVLGNYPRIYDVSTLKGRVPKWLPRLAEKNTKRRKTIEKNAFLVYYILYRHKCLGRDLSTLISRAIWATRHELHESHCGFFK